MKGYLLAEGKRLVLAVLAFLVVFAAVPGLRLVHLLGLLAAGLCALGLLYRNASSRFFGRVMADGIGCLGGFVLARTMLQDRPLRRVSASEYALLFLDFLLWAGLLLWSCRADAAPKREKPPLFKEQVPDKARLIQYIQDLPIVGIHAKWGNGKSFLWENLRSDLQAQFEIVQIDLLACDLDQIEAFLIRELEKVLERGQIYPENAHYLKAQMGKNTALEKLGGIAGESGFSDTFDSLQQELERLPKKVLHKVFYDAKKEEWPARWEAYQLDRIHGRFPKDNTTVMMWGDNALACSFRAMARAGKYAKVQTQLLELLIELERAKEDPAVSDVLLECLSYCNWFNGQDLILMADFFVTLNGGKNPEHLPFYRTFFQNAMKAIIENRYCERMESFMFEWSDKDGFAEHEIEQLGYLKQELEEERATQTVPFLQKELDTLIRFVEKNAALLSGPAPMPQRKPGWKVGEWRSEYSHQTEIDRLKEYRKTHTEAEFEQELQKSRRGLYYVEVKEALKQDK